MEALTSFENKDQVMSEAKTTLASPENKDNVISEDHFTVTKLQLVQKTRIIL